MTTELWFLLATAILLTILWIPYVVGLVKNGGELTPEFYETLEGPKKLPHWVKRANRAHLNLVEQFNAFAAVVLIAHVAGVSTVATVWAAGVYFVARLVHAYAMYSGTAKFQIRTNSFALSMLCILAIAVEIVRNSI